MVGLADLDRVISAIALVTHESAPVADWVRARVTTKYSPSGLGAFEFAYTNSDKTIDEGQSPDPQGIGALSKLTLQHWRLTQDLGQPRWHKMTVTVERSGKYNVDFEYKDDYKEGDIIRRG